MFRSFRIAMGCALVTALPCLATADDYFENGFVVGANLSYSDINDSGTLFATESLDDLLEDGAGFSVSAGYDWFFDNNLMFGIEAEVGQADVAGSLWLPSKPFAGMTTNLQADITQLGSVQARGGVVHNDWLFFAGAGVGLLDYKVAAQINPPPLSAGLDDEVMVPIASLGFEHQIEGGLGIKAEVSHMFVDDSLDIGAVGVPFAAGDNYAIDGITSASVGLVFRF